MQSTVNTKPAKKHSFLIEDILRDSKETEKPQKPPLSIHAPGNFCLNWRESFNTEPPCSCQWQHGNTKCFSPPSIPPPLLRVPSSKFPCGCLVQASQPRPCNDFHLHSFAAARKHRLSPRFIGQPHSNLRLPKHEKPSEARERARSSDSESVIKNEVNHTGMT